MERFPALGLIVRYGALVAALLAVGCAALLSVLLWQIWGAGGVVVGIAAGGVVYLLAKSFVELVIILTEMLVPR